MPNTPPLPQMLRTGRGEHTDGLWGAYLRGHKIRRVAGGHEQPVLSSQLLGKPKITDSDGFRVSRLIHVQDVTWLQVPMNDLEGRRRTQG
jgi:hypothetical protein